jgi:hypothetical protein
MNGGDQIAHSLPAAMFPFSQPKAPVAIALVITWLSLPELLDEWRGT